VHVDEAVLAPLRDRYGEPVRLEWEGEISEREHSLATSNPNRTHDVTLFIFNGERLALIRKHGFEPDIWRPPGGGVKPGEDFVAGVQREALEETGLRIELQRYLVDATAVFVYVPEASGAMPTRGRAGFAGAAGLTAVSRGHGRGLQRRGRQVLPWRTHIFLATTGDGELEPHDTGEIEAARWGTLAELSGPLRERLLATGRAFWRYRVALHDAATAGTLAGGRPSRRRCTD
jgi:8-oxo-dGTP pyrophosphatase MutT (NUDIX family)